MSHKKIGLIFIVCAVLALAVGMPLSLPVSAASNMSVLATDLTTAFTYQGQLKLDGVPVDTTCSIAFKLFDAETTGTQVGSPLDQSVTVVNGLFTTQLNFGAVFQGDALWLEITPDCGGGAVTLPRQPLTATPYALFSAAPWVTSGGNLSYSDGNVGIGTTTPAEKLTVLTPSNSFGIEHTDGTVRLNTWIDSGGGYLGTASDHALQFYTNGDIRMFIDQGGNVGIGTTAPSNTLSVNGGADFAGPVTVNGNAIIDGNVGIGTTSPANTLSVNGGADFTGIVGIGTTSPFPPSYGGGAPLLHVVANAPSATEATTRAFAVTTNDASNPFGLDVRLTGAADIADRAVFMQSTDFNLAAGGNILLQPEGGSVGIGTTDTQDALHVAAPYARIRAESQNDTYAGFIAKSTVAEYFIGISGPGGNWMVYDNTNSASRVTVTTSGNVGIGTTTPTRGKLEVVGSVPYYLASYAYYNSNDNSGISSGTNPISIYATDYVAATEFNAFSDARIKNIQGRSDGAADLAALSQIEITDYTFKDVVAKGSAPLKKVIGQQVEKVYPQAVSRSTDVVPDIYQMAPVKDGWVMLATDLQSGERVRLIGEKKEGVYTVLEVGQESFRTDFEADGDEVFVYGREVDDFLSVDYDAISMLNVSATQELNRLVEQQAAEIETLQSENKALDARLTALEEKVNSGNPTSDAQSKSPLTALLFGGLGIAGLAVVPVVNKRRTGAGR